jgi:hypothetical protein
VTLISQCIWRLSLPHLSTHFGAFSRYTASRQGQFAYFRIFTIMRIHGGKNFGLAAASLIVACVSLAAATGEAQHVREYFYVGGEYITTSAGSLYQNQMYVEKLTPPKVSQKYPIIFLHGGAQTGTVSN